MSRKKEPEPRTRTGLRFPEKPDEWDHMLADQGNTSTGDWRKEIAKTLRDIPEQGRTVHSTLRIGPRLLTIAAECGARRGMSRDGWIRVAIAEAIERESGISAADLLAESTPVHSRSMKDRLHRDD